MCVIARRYMTLFLFNDTATTEIYTLSLHDALPICHRHDHLADRLGLGRVAELDPVDLGDAVDQVRDLGTERLGDRLQRLDRKSTRLNSSHANISFAVFCLKKNKL